MIFSSLWFLFYTRKKFLRCKIILSSFARDENALEIFDGLTWGGDDKLEKINQLDFVEKTEILATETLILPRVVV